VKPTDLIPTYAQVSQSAGLLPLLSYAVLYTEPPSIGPAGLKSQDKTRHFHIHLLDVPNALVRAFIASEKLTVSRDVSVDISVRVRTVKGAQQNYGGDGRTRVWHSNEKHGGA